MRYKPDWPAAEARLTALWNGRHLGRPCIAVTAPRDGGVAWPPAPASAEARWLDPDYVLPALRAALANTCWAGESIPSYLLLAGWLLSCGATPAFAEHTIWHHPRPVDYNAPPAFAYDPDDPWVRRFRALYAAVAEEAGADGFHVGQPLGLPGSDLLAANLGTEEMLFACAAYPEWTAEAILHIALAQVAAFRDFAAIPQGLGNTHWYGNAGWMPFWAPEVVIGTQSDVSCMLSVEMFERFVVPELMLLASELGWLWYHLDGADARQHLPRLLSLPALRVLQYTPAPWEPSNGPAHQALYRAVQAAGKIVHIEVPVAHVEPLVRALDPGLLYLDTRVDTPADADALLRDAERWTKGPSA
jgi:hypothetical protein